LVRDKNLQLFRGSSRVPTRDPIEIQLAFHLWSLTVKFVTTAPNS